MDYKFLSPTFTIGTINIGNIESASCFSVGNNFVKDFKSNKKQNQGFGNVHGDKNLFPNTGAIIKDNENNSKDKDTVLPKPV